MSFLDKSLPIPKKLSTNEFLIRPLLASDVDLDYAAVMESRTFLRQWDQSTWPVDDFTVAENLKHLERHAHEHDNREAFTFTVMNPNETECLGCIYIHPTDARWLAKAKITSMHGLVWADHEALILFWVRQSRLAEGLDRMLLKEIRMWLKQAWAFRSHLFLTSEPFEQQVELLEQSGATRQFELGSAKLAGKFLAYQFTKEGGGEVPPNLNDETSTDGIAGHGN